MKELYLSTSDSIADLQNCLNAYEQNQSVKSILILACDANQMQPEQLDPILQNIQKPLWGGIFPALLHNTQKLDKGFIVAGFETEVHVSVIENISHPQTDFEVVIEELVHDDFEFKTLGVLVDGFSRRISALIESLFLVFGLDCNYIGGGVGSLTMVQKPCLFSNKGMLTDCALLVRLPLECFVEVQHGWFSVAGPFKVTSADRNIITELDYRPAMEVYREVILQHTGKKIEENNFFDLAKAYPFGIHKLDAEMVVRDPIAAQDNQLVCVGEIQEGTFVDVLHGNKKSLVEAASLAAARCKAKLNPEERLFDLFFDCISRTLFLGNDFEQELMEVKSNKVPLIGALSIGEIANNRKEYLEFYNKTAVLACFTK
ncbi:MAG: FIST C-terminal domain-containing protein [Bacteroidota bacterium]|nr:MAG: FIST C-terminal domain-containing protein [Bacteroidota bacterium]